MGNDERTPEEVAGRVKVALESADLASFRDLLDPNVRWGAPDDPTPSCRNRDQVLAWYQRGRDAGVRASVAEVIVGADKLLVGLAVTGNAAPAAQGAEANRWQVLTLGGGRVVDIRGFDDRSEAAVRAGVEG
jgi:ketosteroid isomerase-like protein